MFFRFYTDTISNASKRVAAAIFITGLLLIGFGLLIYALRDFFAILFTILFHVAGIGCLVTAAKIMWVQTQLRDQSSYRDRPYRKNVQIHLEEDDDDQ